MLATGSQSMLIGYARVSIQDQHLELPTEALAARDQDEDFWRRSLTEGDDNGELSNAG
jgi:hypothetical protein